MPYDLVHSATLRCPAERVPPTSWQSGSTFNRRRRRSGPTDAIRKCFGSSWRRIDARRVLLDREVFRVEADLLRKIVEQLAISNTSRIF
jgi:hypothetical protein